MFSLPLKESKWKILRFICIFKQKWKSITTKNSSLFQTCLSKMLEPLKHVLSSHRIILASGSPRRKEILSNSGLGGKFEIIPSTAEENLDRTLAAYKENPWKFAEDTAQLKADEVFQRLTKENGKKKRKKNNSCERWTKNPRSS